MIEAQEKLGFYRVVVCFRTNEQTLPSGKSSRFVSQSVWALAHVVSCSLHDTMWLPFLPNVPATTTGKEALWIHSLTHSLPSLINSQAHTLPGGHDPQTGLWVLLSPWPTLIHSFNQTSWVPTMCWHVVDARKSIKLNIPVLMVPAF